MEFFGLTIARTKALTLSPVRSPSAWWGFVREPFTGAWQRNVQCESAKNILAFSAVHSCVSLISDDIAKLRIKLVELTDKGIWKEVESPAFSPVLRKPNRYQTRIQFLSQWITSKLLYGNSYILKDRDQRGVVVAMYVLDPKLVVPLVAEDGSVYYELKEDNLSGVSDPITVPASEIIHDRMMTPWHPLIGVSPIFACGSSSTQGIRIQAMSAKFFENMARPSGQLTAPGAISNDTASRLKAEFEERFSGQNIGRLFVGGDGLKYEPFTMPFSDAQLIEQLRWTVEDVARTFHVPLHKLGMGQPTLNNIGALNQDYYAQALQKHLEDIEILLDEGLGLVNVDRHTYGTELDLDGLLRMDPLSRAETAAKWQGVAKINELRLKENWAPVPGGEAVYLQQQNYSTEALGKRDAQPDPFKTNTPQAPSPASPVEPAPTKAQEDSATDLASALIAKFTKAPTYG